MTPKNAFRLAFIFGWMAFSTAGFAQSSAKQINDAIKNTNIVLNDSINLISKYTRKPSWVEENSES